MITENPTDGNATTLIIFDEPLVKQKIIHNTSGFPLEFCKFDSNKYSTR